jgi:NADPH-dependent ferric siderophore reductase
VNHCKQGDEGARIRDRDEQEPAERATKVCIVIDATALPE